MAKYMFTWSTRLFYKKDAKGNVKRLKGRPKKWKYIVGNAPSWVEIKREKR